MKTPLRVGVDFDNTIICYDHVFHQVAVDDGLIPATVPVSKGSVRDYLREAGKEDAWTAMQGYVYGVRMVDAPPFPGARECLQALVRGGVEVFIVSHKTRHPYLGPRYDLHRAAHGWLDKNGFFDATAIGMKTDQLFLELTKQDKLRRIGDLHCTHFIDDLPELLGDAGFPGQVQRILFDPKDEFPALADFPRAQSWAQIKAELQAA